MEGQSDLSGMEMASAFQPRLEEYECAICKDLVFKPAVNVCQHVFCFWCLHQSMNNVSESNCPLCRREYGHLARTCGLLHFFLGNAFPAEYRARQAEVLADEERREIAADDLDTDPVLPEPSPSIPPQTPSQTLGVTQNVPAAHTSIYGAGFPSPEPGQNGRSEREEGFGPSSSGVQRRPYPYARPGTKYAFRGVDFGCTLCKQLLHEPTVLVCGHVFCLPCIRARSSDPRCPLCRIMQSESPRNLVPCATIADLVSRAFPEAAAARAREVVAHGGMNPESTASEPERPPTVQAAMSRTRALLLAAHADLVRRGEPFNLRAMTERLLEDLDPRYVVHFGVGCDGCGQSPIVGERYQCKDCQEALGFDMCGHCYAMEGAVRGLFDQRHSRQHRVVRIPPLAALTSRHFGIDPYRVLFTNPELPYQAVQRMRDEMHEDGELDFLLGELEEAEIPDSPESTPSDPGYGPPSEHDFRTAARRADLYPSLGIFPAFDGDFDTLAPDGPVARHRIGRSLRLPGSPVGGGAAQAGRTQGGETEGVRTAEPGSAGETPPSGAAVWTRRVGRDWRAGQPGASARGGSIFGRLGGGASAPGSAQPGNLRRTDGGFLGDPRASRLSAWLETMPPEYPERGGGAQRAARHGIRGGDVRARHNDVMPREGEDRAIALQTHVRLLTQLTEARANQRRQNDGPVPVSEGQLSGNGSDIGSDGESVRGEWHDVHEGGVEGQELPRARPPGFGERRLRRSFGRRHAISFPLRDSPAAEVTSAENEVEMGDAVAIPVPQPEGDVTGEREQRVVDAGLLLASPDASSEEETPSREAPGPRLRHVQVYSPEAMVQSRSARETAGGFADSPRRRRSMDGLPPLPPRRRALSASPLERRAGLLMLTLASTAAEHPSFGGGSRDAETGPFEGRERLVERPRAEAPLEVRTRFRRESEAAPAGGSPSVEEQVEQQFLAGYANRFDTRRTVQDMQVAPSPAEGTSLVVEPSVGAPHLGNVADVSDPAPDVVFEGSGLERARSVSDPLASGAQQGGDVGPVGETRSASMGSAASAPRQSYSLVDSLVRALGGQRRRPRDVQPEGGEASPSQVRRLRRPEE